VEDPTDSHRAESTHVSSNINDDARDGVSESERRPERRKERDNWIVVLIERLLNVIL